jgi:vacuolar protein sorting-associated protein 13A/C
MKDAVIISHPQKDLAKEIIVSNSVRDLKIHIQHEREEKGMTAKVIYFYVPCWLDSERCPLLKIRLVELELPKEKKGKKKEKTESTKHEKKKSLLQPPLKVKNVIDEINQDNRDQVHHQTMLSRYEPKMMGLAVALSADDDKTHFGDIEPLDPLDNSDGSVELITQDVHGSYYKFLVTRMSNPYGFAQAEVLCIRPYTIFTNRIGQRIHLRQEGAEQFRTIDPTDSTTFLPFVKLQEPLKLQVQLEGSLWSHPFAIQKEEKMYLAIHPRNGRSSRRKSIRVDVRGYEDGSRFCVLLQCGSSRGPYR